ncbi:Pectate lyase [Balamuthia mandrillaris]
MVLARLRVVYLLLVFLLLSFEVYVWNDRSPSSNEFASPSASSSTPSLKASAPPPPPSSPSSSLSSSSSSSSSSSPTSPSHTHRSYPPSALELQENYPGSCHSDTFVTVDNLLPGYTASGYVRSHLPHQARFEWKVHSSADNAQVHTLEFWYFSLLSQPVTFSLLVNWEAVLSFGMEATNASWQSVSVTAILPPGVNSIVLQASNDKSHGELSLLFIDSLVIYNHDLDHDHYSLPLLRPVHCHNNEVVPLLKPNPRCFAGATFRDEVVDCGGARVGLSCDGDREDQPAVITLYNATLKNLRIAAHGGADGIHCNSGNCNLDNIIWEDICEDAATHSADGGIMTIEGGWAFNGNGGWGGTPDKIFQHNAKNSTVIVTKGFRAKGQNGILYKSCGNCKDNGGPRFARIEDVIIEEGRTKKMAVANSNYGDTVTIRDLFVRHQKDHKACFEFFGVEEALVEGHAIGQQWESKVCDVAATDVKRLDTIHVVVAVNKDYLVGLLALLRSIGRNTAHPEAVMVHVIISASDADNGEEHGASALGQKVLCEGCPPVDVTKFNLRREIKDKLNNHYREELNEDSNYARLFLHLLFPSLDRIIWLDSDTLALGDLRELWQTPMTAKGIALAAVPRFDRPLKREVDSSVQTAFQYLYPERRYNPEEATFNTGVFVADLKKWRKRRVEEEFLWWIELRSKYETLWMFATQPLIWVVFHQQWVQLGEEWNVIDLGWNNAAASKQRLNAAKVLHWNGSKKPWMESAIASYQTIWKKLSLNILLLPPRRRRSGFPSQKATI